MNAEIDGPVLYGESRYLKKLFDISAGALVVCDSSRQILQNNPSFSQLFQTSEENCIGRDLDELITPAPFLPESECVFDTAITGTPVSIKTVKVKNDGTLARLFQIAVQIITDSGDKLVCFIFKQIPENSQQRTTDKCSHSKLLTNAFENSCEPSLYSDAAGNAVRANTTFHAEFGWTPEDISEHSIAEILIPKTISPEAEYIIAMLKAERTLRLRTTRKKKDKSTLTISLICAPYSSDVSQAKGGYRIYRTGNSRAQTNADVVSRNNFRECPYPELHTGMFFQARVNRERTMEFIAPGSASFAGFSEIELLSESKPYASVILSEDLSMVLKTIDDSLENRKDYSITYRIKNSSGNTLWVMERGRAYSMSGDEPDFCVGCIVDISETKKDREDSSLARDRIEKLHKVAAELQKCRSAGEIYRICTEAGQSILNGACSSVFIHDDHEMKQIASSGREYFNCTKDCNPGMADLTLSTVSPCYFSAR
ncbi:MAG: PAS domain S-box protein, partial [Candidatus Sabulitectum sp.]|nr:PAS domain S-box protein [Candidatus Sabulitectum sp.]